MVGGVVGCWGGGGGGVGGGRQACAGLTRSLQQCASDMHVVLLVVRVVCSRCLMVWQARKLASSAGGPLPNPTPPRPLPLHPCCRLWL